MVLTRCNGCGASFKRSGIAQHCHLSRNPACHAFLLDTEKNDMDQVQTTAENPENEAYMQDDDEIGMNDVLCEPLGP